MISRLDRKLILYKSMISIRPEAIKMKSNTGRSHNWPWSCLLKMIVLMNLVTIIEIGSIVVDAQTALLSSLYLHHPSSSILPATLSRRDLNAKQTTVSTLYNRGDEARLNRQSATATTITPTSVCQVYGGESVAILEIEESRGSELNQSTNPIELPISGSTDEIELRIESETHKYFKIHGKELRLIKPLDRDAVLKENQTNQILSQPVSTIYLQISCSDRRAHLNQRDGSRRNVIVPVLVKVSDLNDNAPKFTQQTYTIQVDELTPAKTVLIDTIQAFDLDSANNGLIEYTLYSANGEPIRSDQQSQRLIQRVAPARSTDSSRLTTTQKPQEITTFSTSISSRPISTDAPTANSDIYTTVATLSRSKNSTDSDQSSISFSNYSNDLTQTTVRTLKSQTPTINLNSEPIINGPMEDGNEDEENDEALLASMNSTDTDMEGDSDHAQSIKFGSALIKRKKRSQHHGSFMRRLLVNNFETTPSPQPSNLWTNLMFGGESIETAPLNSSLSNDRYSNDFVISKTAESSANELFSLSFAPNSNKPIIGLKKELDYETKRIHYLTIVATDRAANKEDRLSSEATIVIKVLDGDDQGPAFVLEQTGCVTRSLPSTTTSGPNSSADHQNRIPNTRGRRFASDILEATGNNFSDTKSESSKQFPKGFKITDENFDYSDTMRANNDETIDSSELETDQGSSMATTDNEPSIHSTRSRRIVAQATGRNSHSIAPYFSKNSQMNYDYGCLPNSPMSYNGQAEYHASVMSGDSDYLLHITPQAIKARDRDELNAPIKYSFINGTPDNFHLYFQINSIDASVKQIAPVDRNHIREFTIWVRAQEQTTKKLSSTAKLVIDVIPTDKNPPMLVPNSYSGFVEENSPVGSLVMISNTNRSTPMVINVQDIDNRATDSSLISGKKQLYDFETTSDAFKVNHDGLVYVNKAQLDRDYPNQPIHVFQVTARQSGLLHSKSVSSPISINVTLLDLNDNPPIISNSSLVPLQIRADTRPVRYLTTIQSADIDDPTNSKVRFSIHHVSNNGRDKFRIHPDTGQLEGLGKFNVGEQFSLTIQITDELGRFSQGIIEISVVPGPNTNGPQFVITREDQHQEEDRIAPGYQVEINEGIAINSAILQLRAVDPENDPISYAIIDGNINNDFFINSKTGIIYVANKLDREEVSAYNLLVQARDSGGLASNRPVSIIILDNNDENPVFQKQQYIFSVEEGNSSLGKIIGSVQATDADFGDNGLVNYYDSSPILQTNHDGKALFSIDERTGDIKLIEPLDYEQVRSHSLIITAKDNGEKPRSTTTSVLVRVLDVQDEKPYFDRSYLELKVEENLANFKLASINALDPDSVSNITYELKYGDPTLFAVDPSTGFLSTLIGLDYETSTNHTLIIGTSDNPLTDLQLQVLLSTDHATMSTGPHNRSPICRVNINVIDMNDCAPQFSSQPMPVRVQDTVQLGSIVTKLNAEDHDGSRPNNQLHYEVVDDPSHSNLDSNNNFLQSCQQLFMIDSNTGTISVKSDLRRSGQSECNLIIKVSDLGQQPHSLSSSVSITIFIDHVAESSTTTMIGFADTSFTVEIEENIPPNSLIKVLPIINKPRLINFPISCEILSGNELAQFYITQNELKDCELRLTKNQLVNLDYELKQRYTLTIRLNTIGSSTGKGINVAQVNINVLDKNDNKPSFSQPSRYSHLTQNRFLAAIPVDAPSETQLIQLKAHDFDSPHSNGLISYEILNEGELGGRFKVDPVDGVVRTSRSVEDIPSSLLPVHLRILARDNPDHVSETLTSEAEILVNLIEDRHRLALVLRDTISARVLDSREEILGVIQERSGLITGFDRAESLKVQRNGTIESDVTGTDFWFYLIEPGTFRLVTTDDSRVKNTLLDTIAQNSLKDMIGQTLGFTDVSIRLPYSIITGDSTLLGRTFSSSSHVSGSKRASNLASGMITIGMIIAVISAIVIVYQCGSRSSRRAANAILAKNQLQPPGYYHYNVNPGNTGDYSHFSFPKLPPSDFTQGQDNIGFSGSAFSTLPNDQRRRISTDQTESDRTALSLMGKEYETQMLKMSVLFDDTQSFDERNLNENIISHNLR